MKTSFYFVIWIIIYPLLGLLHNPWIDANSFIVALIVVWGLGWYINRSMGQTIAYERIIHNDSILNEVYTGNVEGFRKRLSRMSMLDFITAVYFGVAFLVALLFMLKYGQNSWVELFIFGVLAIGTLINASRIQSAAWRLRKNPDPEHSVEVVEEALRLDYNAYYNLRQNAGSGNYLPPPPPHFKGFQICSLIIAVICAALGLLFMLGAVLMFVSSLSFGGISYGIMSILYGSLAFYYGVRDAIACSRQFRTLYNKKNSR